jgi:hypothetical protein
MWYESGYYTCGLLPDDCGGPYMQSKLDILNEVIEKFEKAVEREDYKCAYPDCPVCVESGFAHGYSKSLMCKKCYARFGLLFNIGTKDDLCEHCMNISVGYFRKTTFEDAINGDDDWKRFRRKYLRILKRKKRKLERRR